MISSKILNKWWILQLQLFSSTWGKKDGSNGQCSSVLKRNQQHLILLQIRSCMSEKVQSMFSPRTHLPFQWHTDSLTQILASHNSCVRALEVECRKLQMQMEMQKITYFQKPTLSPERKPWYTLIHCPKHCIFP